MDSTSSAQRGLPQNEPEAEPLEPDTMLRTLLGLLVKPALTHQERRALSEAIATLRVTKAAPTRPFGPFIKHG